MSVLHIRIEPRLWKGREAERVQRSGSTWISSDPREEKGQGLSSVWARDLWPANWTEQKTPLYARDATQEVLCLLTLYSDFTSNVFYGL